MGVIYHEKFSNDVDSGSVWVTITPSNTTLSLPFYVMEAGTFIVGQGYRVSRNCHNSFLMLYTIKGNGFVKTRGSNVELNPGSCIIIDCHIPHEYYGGSDTWEFQWIHFSGNGVQHLFEILYPSNVREIQLMDAAGYESFLQNLFSLVESDDVVSSVEISVQIHKMFSILLKSELNHKQKQKKEGKDDCNQEIITVVEFIKNNYNRQITIEDMISDIPISKYHFIRCFRRVMGMPPYSYLTNYRINMAKIMLGTTKKSVAEIAECCGFQETSNFISHFKKNTGMRPTQYRRFFE